MKIKLFVIVVLCAMLFSSVSFAASNFVDLDNDHWAYESISDLSAKKIINGYEDGTFRPSHTISRAELAAILTKVMGDSISNESTITYADVDPTAWYAASVKQASLFLQLLPRDGIHYFEPNRAATREEITGAIVGILTIAEAVDNNKQKYLDRFTDKDEIDPYFRTFVGFAVEKGIISGYGDHTFKPRASVSRAEAAFMIKNAFEEWNYSTVQPEADGEQDIHVFEGKWSTPGSDELAFNLSFTDENSGTITFYSEGEEYPNHIEMVRDGNMVIFNYEGMEKINVLKLIDSKTLLFEDYEGRQVSLSKQEVITPTNENEGHSNHDGMSQQPVDYSNGLMNRLVGSWADSTDKLRVKIESTEYADRGVITFYGINGTPYSFSFILIKLEENVVKLVLEGEYSVGENASVTYELVNEDTMNSILGGYNGEITPSSREELKKIMD